MSENKRPTSATVFGILNIVFGGLGTLGGLANFALFALSAVLGLMGVISWALSILLLVGGILLLINKSISPKFNFFVAIGSLVISLIFQIYYKVAFGALYGTGTMITALIIGAVYPVLLIIFMRKPEIESYYSSQS